MPERVSVSTSPAAAALDRLCRRDAGPSSMCAAPNALAADRVYFSAVDNVTERPRPAHQRRERSGSTSRAGISASTRSRSRSPTGSPPACRCASSATAARSSRPTRTPRRSSTGSRTRACRSGCASTRRGFPRSITGRWRSSSDRTSVEFGSGNFAPTELAPVSSTNYDDETELFTDDPTLVNAFKTKFDVMWNDTTPEPESIVGRAAVPQGLERRLRERADRQLRRLPHAVPESGADDHQHRAARGRQPDAART